MIADFNPTVEDTFEEDLLIGLLMLGAVGGLMFVGYKIYEMDKQPTQPKPAKLNVELDKPYLQNGSPNWSKDTIIWLQKYVNRQILAPHIGQVLGNTGDIVVEFIPENGILDKPLFSALVLWEYFLTGNQSGIMIADLVKKDNLTLRQVLSKFGVPPAVVSDQKLIMGKLPNKPQPYAGVQTKSNPASLVLPDIHTPIKNADQNTIKWVQKYLNTVYNMPKLLMVDGVFSSNTRKYFAEYLKAKHFVFGVDYSPEAQSLAQNFVNYDLDTLMGADQGAQVFMVTAL